MQLCTVTSFLSGVNETVHILNEFLYYLESIAKLIKVSLTIEHQSAETNT